MPHAGNIVPEVALEGKKKRTARDRPRPPARNGTEGNGRAHPGPEGGAPQAAADIAAKGRAARMPYAAPAATTQLLRQVPVASCHARPVWSLTDTACQSAAGSEPPGVPAPAGRPVQPGQAGRQLPARTA